MTKRSAQLLGVLVICLGVLLALPFRHSVPRALERTASQAVALSELNLEKKDGSPATQSVAQAPRLSPATAPLKLTPISPLGSPPGEPQFELTTRPVPELANRYQPPVMPKRPPRKPTADELPRRHLVVDGDTLENLALRYLGSKPRAKEIVRANPGLDPQLLPIRRYITIPPKFPPRRPARTKLVPIK